MIDIADLTFSYLPLPRLRGRCQRHTLTKGGRRLMTPCVADYRATSREDWGGELSYLQLRNVDPAALFPALVRALDELHALGALDQPVREGRVLDDVADEHLPLGLEAVLVGYVVRHLL